METKRKKAYEHFIITAVLTLLPLAACFVLSLKDGFKFSEFYLPNAQHVKWNDEIFYYKMIGAFSEYNRPLGCFGYNESSACFGNLGYWSPALFVFYGLYAKIFGWSLLSPLCCNLILMMGALFVFARMVRPTRQQTFFCCILYGCSLFFTRFVFSGMLETFIYALSLIFFSVSVKMFKRAENKSGSIYWIILNILAFWMTLTRPYWILLFVIPGYDWYQSRKKKLAIWVETGISVLCGITYFLLTKYFCAPYLENMGGIKTEWLKLLFSRPLHGIYNIMQIFVTSLFELLHYAGDGIVNGNAAGGVCALYILMIFWIANKLMRCEKNKRIFWGYSLFYLAAMLLAIFYLYNINNGYRQLACFVFLFIFMASLYEKSDKKYLYILFAFVWIFCIRADDSEIYHIPTYSDEKARVLNEGADELEEAGIIDLDSDNPWDNTVIWVFGDKINFTYLYALPDGVGINLCLTEWVKANFTNLKSKYIYTNIGGEIDILCEQEKELVAEYANIHIWKLR